MANPGYKGKPEALERFRQAYAKCGTIAAAARELGIPQSTAQHQYNALKDKGALPASALKVSGTSTLRNADGEVILEWTKTKEGELSPEVVAERVRGALEGMKAAKPVKAPKLTYDHLCTLYPVTDPHLGMRAWGKETGGPDYDLHIARDDMRHAFTKVTALTPPSAEALLVLNGDTLHADDDRAETPAHKHKLDVDGRQFKVIDETTEIIADTIDTLLNKHSVVRIRVMRGNHDLHSHLVLTFALHERYRDEPRVIVEKDPRDLFMFQWGRTAIFLHHGDKAKPERQALYISDVCPFWSETHHRYYFTGHVHKDQAADIGPLKWESLRAFCPPDSYASGMGYAARRALQAFTFDKQDGLTLRAIDPIERTKP